jgi:CubicO group peptidase (beta-lactamase class C family)
MDVVALIGRMQLGYLSRSRVPRDLESVTHSGEEAAPREVGASRKAIEAIWQRADALYRTGTQPGFQLCIRRRGAVALDRSIGHAWGNAPDDPPDAPRLDMTTQTPVNVFSAAKAITAMLIHKLDEDRVLHLDDRVAEFIPEFACKGKERITIRHVLSHRAGIPNLPPDAMRLELLAHPERVIELLSEAEPSSTPGRLLAYHAVTGGFVLAEIVRRATGQSLRELLEKQIREPLGLRWLHYGVKKAEVDLVARNARTGPPVPPPLSWILTRALGAELGEIVELSNDPRFLTGLVPSANVITTARDIASFYQCLLNGGELDGVRVFDPRTIHHAIDEQNAWEIDLTLMMPIAYSTGFMLGNHYLSLYGWNHPEAFGHIGLSNVFSWADPQRELVVALLTTGKPVASLHVIRLIQLISQIHETFPPVRRRRAA